ncbi:hypothetical protein BD413DRAFT_479552 [Trametes elegans]|nr:hypothetical protein BD413DRAFT_479552 [Trametes elegans]
MTTCLHPRSPEEWSTGHEPMTARQEVTLNNVANYRGLTIPFIHQQDRNGQNVTMAEAYVLIHDTLRGFEPTKEHPDPLGWIPDDAVHYTTPGYPTVWKHCHDTPTPYTLDWVTRLASDLVVSDDVKANALKDMTRGQVSLLMAKWREKEGQRNMADDIQYFFECASDDAFPSQERGGRSRGRRVCEGREGVALLLNAIRSGCCVVV